jgi:outer membrane lipoprotein LolB
MKSCCVATKALPAVVGFALLLSGCQSVAPVEPVAGGKPVNTVLVRELKLREVTDFQFSGGLGIWTETESIPARIRWAQSNDDLYVNFSGPLGLGDLKLQDKAGLVTLSRGKTVVTSGTSSDDVIQRGLRLSAPVPVEELKQWVRGLPGQGQAIQRDSEERVASLRYTDLSGVEWSVRFKRYEKVDQLSLPALITASGGAYSVRLLLKNWELSTNMSELEVNEPNKRLSIPGR